MWKLFQVVVFGAVFWSGLQYQWTDVEIDGVRYSNGYVLVLVSLLAAGFATAILCEILDRFRRLSSKDRGKLVAITQVGSQQALRDGRSEPGKPSIRHNLIAKIPLRR